MIFSCNSSRFVIALEVAPVGTLPARRRTLPVRSLRASFQTSDPKPLSKPAPPVVLSIAGYDPSAGAGVLADLKTFAANGVYGMACITALTVQSSLGVQRVEPLEPGIVVETLDCLEKDVHFASIKVGILGRHEMASAVVDWLQHRPNIPVVLDPVLKSSSGKDLLDQEGLEILRDRWLARSHWITPNLLELETLIGETVEPTHDGIEMAAKRLLEMAIHKGNSGLKVVVTGGHTEKPDDLLFSTAGSRWYAGEYIKTDSTHGTGCAFSSALAAFVALGSSDFLAVRAAKEYVAGALCNAYPVGKGNGPPNHLWNRST